jgi:hydroxypyruvate reductase
MKLRDIATDIFHRTLAAIEVEAVVRQALQINGSVLRAGDTEIDLRSISRFLVIAVGKASVPMARAAAAVLENRFVAGLIATNALDGEPPPGFEVFIGGHPVPNQASIDAAQAALKLCDANSKQTLVLFLLSGGGSALFETPIDESITLNDLQTINRVLVGCGAVIGEMNVVRRFLSAVKGGRLAEAAAKARQISLYISDVNSDDLSTVSSGLTLPSTATRADFDNIVAKYDLLNTFPPHVAALIASGNLPNMPPALPHHSRTHHLLLDNRVALRIAKQIAEHDHNCMVEIAEDLVEGDVEAMAQEHLRRLQTLRERHPNKTVCLLSGGEVICPVRGNGQGGRNQEFVLRAALNNRADSIAILSAGTDGIDGHSPAAGALADETTLPRAAALNLAPEDYLQRSDSFNFFNALGDAILIGPTGNNVRDLRIFLA